jgi:flavin-dependent dehydrogenase
LAGDLAVLNAAGPAADGANGVCRRAWDWTDPRGRAVAFEVVLPRAALLCPFDGPPCFDFGAIEKGYGWVFPKSDELSVGLYSLAQPVTEPRDALVRYLESKRIRSSGDPLASFAAHTIPVGGIPLERADRPLYLAGDSAALADALTGEGIWHALESGRVAGETAARVASGEAQPGEYAARLQTSVLRDARLSFTLARHFYRHPRLALRALELPILWRPLVHGFGRGANLAQCLTRALPLWIGSLRAAGVRRERVDG